ncbi:MULTISPECIES: RNA-guided endonuclease TnpB family protein [unclassified Anabaena]|uniref:RNA-guided endonuclease InsQ/TnpB family protein n=1 Tax=unclassified Anabaena TaxID=2619674 RepID=UPI000836164D|nr:MULTISPECIES: RNA-guided endonuclease TnpB family protein [unclassified Anabaena]
MQVVERHIIQRNHPHHQEIEQLCFAAKNLYNYANFHIRQSFIFAQKYLDYNCLAKQLKSTEPYQALPAKVAQQVLLGLHRNWLSFFAAIKAYGADKSKFLGRPKLPKYKHKEKGRHLLVYTAQAVSKPKMKVGLIHLSQTQIHLTTKVDYVHLNQVRIVPKIDHYVVEVVYEKSEIDYGLDSNAIAAIDLGIDNLATLTSNQPGFIPVLVSGRIIKSINRYYNQKKANLQSLLPGHQKTSKQLQSLTKKRNFRVDDYLHKASRLIIDHLVNCGIGTLVIGQNSLWKQNANLGSINNQNFVCIPHNRFVQQLSYKAKLVGINVLVSEESYTSVASFLDQDTLPTYGESDFKEVKFSGRRIKTKLYRAGNGLLIHADVNGSLNILRKVVPTAFSLGIGGVVVRPVGVIPGKRKP